MILADYNILLSVIGFLTAAFGVWWTILKIAKELRKSAKHKSDKILDEARAYDEAITTLVNK